ncbi:MAG: DUF2235 domain-containing protein [Candidatus Marinimicrobia bacterium]|nr:DUF2235 domain-containing protein [Candidatus Neomarinimicrobiota bacterium]MCF7830273.1 DUF2235 domain-containing protein [Candidatus Neomarinimicrobiota bacterium]MCF7882182.1 DUF2235 domain-containing protein [Candidatus Neomarinimicrobiota bacterium]
MRNLIVCADGTWNTPDQEESGVPIPTNVVRIFNSLADVDDNGNDQLKYYHPGVGTEGSWWDKVKGGSVGEGLSKNIMSGYRWLGGHYRSGDRIYLFGFSRGAYTVRSLGGMISQCGLLDLTGIPDNEVWTRVEKAYKFGYREKQSQSEWAGNWNFHADNDGDGRVPIYFIGVWDTVGALGIPDDLAILNFFDDRDDYLFHNTKLGDTIVNARHAVALDEIRASFTPTLWDESGSDVDVKQVWFSGVHSDVGGGYPEIGLSNIALQWMIDEASEQGLNFLPDMVSQINPDPRDVLHDSYRGAFSLLRSQPRSAPQISGKNPAVHESVIDRRDTPPIAQAPYRKTRTVPDNGEGIELVVYADQPWNHTRVYLKAGVEYKLEAAGEWVDRTITCGPGGAHDGKFQPAEIAHLLGTLWGKAETLFRNITGNREAEFMGTRRYEKYPWFSLVGVVGDGGNPTGDGTPEPHSHFLIGDGTTFTPATSGYLYCFANDAWNFYGNNRGSVRLRIAR